jgi:hypothetical protein
MRNFIFWFCVPWALFFGFAAVLYFYRYPDKLLYLLPIIVLLGFASRAEYLKLKDKAVADAAREKATQARAAPRNGGAPAFNPRGPGQFTSFAFRYTLPSGLLKLKALPAPPKALPPPNEDL